MLYCNRGPERPPLRASALNRLRRRRERLPTEGPQTEASASQASERHLMEVLRENPAAFRGIEPESRPDFTGRVRFAIAAFHFIGTVVSLGFAGGLASRPAIARPAIARPAIARPAITTTVPLPPPRPHEIASPQKTTNAEPSEPSACRLRLSPDLAIAPSLPPITGPDDCGATDVVRLEGVLLPDRTRVTVTPPAILRCTMAEAVVGWVRQAAAPRALDLGSPLRVVENLASFDCRPRNGATGAKISEHGKANALDLISLRLANGRVLELTDPHVPKDFREDLRRHACSQFTTVLGPGSDGFHEDHIHVDLLQRQGGYRICQWDVREPAEAASVSTPPTVPLPPTRPPTDSSRRKMDREARPSSN